MAVLAFGCRQKIRHRLPGERRPFLAAVVGSKHPLWRSQLQMTRVERVDAYRMRNSPRGFASRLPLEFIGCSLNQWSARRPMIPVVFGSEQSGRRCTCVQTAGLGGMTRSSARTGAQRRAAFLSPRSFEMGGAPLPSVASAHRSRIRGRPQSVSVFVRHDEARRGLRA